MTDEYPTCPKCDAESGNDWSQCEGSCPMPGSPHYKNGELWIVEALEAWRLEPEFELTEAGRAYAEHCLTQ